MEKDYLKGYTFILEDKKLDLAESILLCMYLDKFFYHNGVVITSDSKDSEVLKIDRKYVGKKRKHLEELGYIKCSVNKGKSISVQLNKDIANKAFAINMKLKNKKK